MDPSIAWLQPEQEGPAKAVWLRLWTTQKDFDSLNIANGECDSDSVCTTNSQSTVSLTNGTPAGPAPGFGPTPPSATPITTATAPPPATTAAAGEGQPQNKPAAYYPNRRRKIENRASTRGMNLNHAQIIGEFGGTPWRRNPHNYQRSVLG